MPRLPSLLTAYRTLIHSGLGERRIWRDINEMVQSCSLSQNSDFETYVQDQHKHSAVQALQQKMLSESLNTIISPAFMTLSAGVHGSHVISLPRIWRSFMKRKGIGISIFSGCLFALNILRRWRGGYQHARFLKSSSHPPAPKNSYAVTFDIVPGALPDLNDDPEKVKKLSYWIQKKFPHDVFWHATSLRPDLPAIAGHVIYPQYLPALRTLESEKAFSRHVKSALWRALRDILRGRWQPAFMMKDIVTYLYVRHLHRDDVAKAYFFTNSHYMHRPLWTYEMADKGSKIHLIFYSTNGFNIKMTDGMDNGYCPGYQNMTWPIYHTMTPQHADFIRECVTGSPDIHVQGLIPFEDKAEPINLGHGKKMVFFDVQPFRPEFMAGIGRPCHFYTPEISRQSFEDIAKACRADQIHFFCKPKRDVGDRLCPEYDQMLSEGHDQGLWHVLDHRISPARICAEADIVICQPFTSAGLFAQALGKPSAYYDPMSIFEKNQPASQGIPVLQGSEELMDWIKGVIHEQDRLLA
ncbi:MAG: polysaccharide biosynthesis PFTS motif protein [Alphaproteobacteria bacterium]|nr:polysaccharide biosynthesis PFTS motif protein [Alphaproteobacteria bacterium]